MTKQLAPYIDLHTHHVRSTPDTVELLSCYLSEAVSYTHLTLPTTPYV